MTDLPPFVPTKEFKYSAPPNPGWTYGQGIEATEDGRAWAEGEKAGWKVVDISKEDPRQVYAVLLSGILPRPVAFVSSLSKDGVENLAPFSWFNEVSSRPAVLSFSCAYTAQGAKDTAQNVRDTKGFTVNIISEPWIEQANICSIDTPPDVSEWAISGLTKAPSIQVKAPRVKESAFSMECEFSNLTQLLQAIDITEPSTGEITATLILGTIKYIHIRNDVVDPARGVADPSKLRPIARMGGVTYAKVSDGYALPRESWKEKEKEIRKVLGSAIGGNERGSAL
ncbi:unnamed protein product [Cyclocybe aegerita]|uniref:Flavin reductase like domain-containing protein n=1 Tax=Cyclocybe aegerita TaxID=1973307 RepID=A0A8S0WEU3_CYCAE|nr:unnamed protein product [Cyclocybe aegerita]